MNSAQTTYGLVGYPVSHSLSPFMHNTAFKALEVDAIYKLFPLKEEELDDFFRSLKEPDSPIFGLNVTVPYKEKALKYLDSLSPFAQKIMAVNTIVITDSRQLVGHNTDGPGFLAHLAELQFDPEGRRVAVLGAGGAARALIASLCLLPQRPESIRIYDVDQNKADQLIKDMAQRFDVAAVETVPTVDDLNLELADLLINATPLGMKPGDICPVDESELHRDMMVYDLVYNPVQTTLLKRAKAKGARTANGLGMLFYQGVLAFQHWAQIELDQKTKDLMRSSLEQGRVL